MEMPPLTDLQRQILEHAVDHHEGRIEWFPEKLKDAARERVLLQLSGRGLVTTDGACWFVSAAGYDVIGRDRPAVWLDDPFEELERLLAVAEAMQELLNKGSTLHEPAPAGSGYGRHRR